MLKIRITTALILGAASVLGVLSACGPRIEDELARKAASPAPVASAVPSSDQLEPPKTETKDHVCRTLMESYNSSTAAVVASAQTYNVERHFQRVIRKDCQGRVTSDGIETVKSPHVQFRLHLPKPREFKSVFLFNETSCDHILSGAPKKPSLVARMADAIIPFSKLTPIHGDGKSYVDVSGDLATALLTFEMANGPNVVFAEYHYDCMPRSINGNVRAVRRYDEKQSCDASVDKHIVMYPVATNYEEKTLPGVKIVESDKSQCERDSQTSK